HAKAFQIDGATMLTDQDNGSRQLAGRHLMIKEVSDALEFFRRGSGHLRSAAGQRSVREGYSQHDCYENPVWRITSGRTKHRAAPQGLIRGATYYLISSA